MIMGCESDDYMNNDKSKKFVFTAEFVQRKKIIYINLTIENDIL